VTIPCHATLFFNVVFHYCLKTYTRLIKALKNLIFNVKTSFQGFENESHKTSQTVKHSKALPGLCGIWPKNVTLNHILNNYNRLCSCWIQSLAVKSWLRKVFWVFSSVFKLNWNILPIGTSWIYPVYPPDYTPGTLRYCHKTTYQLAFAVTTLVWVATTLMFICSCCFALLTCCKMVMSGHRLIPNRYSFYGATSDSHEPAGGDVWCICFFIFSNA